MRLKDYLQDKLGSIFIILIGLVISILLLNAIKYKKSKEDLKENEESYTKINNY